MTTDVYSNDLIEVGDLIRQQREKLGKTQFELAEMSGLGEKSISRHELGIGSMKLATFFMLADALHVSPVDLSPRRFLSSENNSDFKIIERKLSQLNGSQKALAVAMIHSIIDNISQHS